MWNEVDDLMNEIVDPVFHESTFFFEPRSKGLSVNDPDQLDETRKKFEFKGTLELGPSRISSEAGLAMDQGARAVGITFEGIIVANFKTAPSIPKRGDLLLQENGPSYVVVEPAQDGSDYVVFYVNKARKC